MKAQIWPQKVNHTVTYIVLIYIYITYARKTVSSLVDRFVFMSDKLYSVARLISDPQGRDLIANPINIK